VQELNKVGVEINRAKHASRAHVRALKAEMQRRRRIEILSLKVEGSSSAERLAMAEVNAEKNYRREKLVEMFVQQQGRRPTEEELQAFIKTLTPEQIPITLQQELNNWDLLKEQVDALSKAFDNKRHELKEHDAAVRLQAKSIEMELRAFGSTAHPINVPKILGDNQGAQKSIEIGNQILRFDDDEDSVEEAPVDLVITNDFKKLTSGDA